MAVHSLDQGGWAAPYSRRKADTTCLDIWVSPAHWCLFYLLLLLSHQNTRIEASPEPHHFPDSSFRRLPVLPLQLASPASKSPAAATVQMSCLLLPDFCLCRPASHTRGRVRTPAASTGFPDLWLEPSASFLLPKKPQLPTPNATSQGLVSRCGCDEPDPKSWVSPQVQLTVLWKLRPVRCASLTQKHASHSSSWPSKWLPPCPGSTFYGLSKRYVILSGLCCKDPFPWFCHISYHRPYGYA